MPGMLWFMGLQRVGHDWATELNWSSTLAWQIPWLEEPSRVQSAGSLGVEHERLHFHFSLSCIGEGNGNPLQCSCLENPRDGGAWWAAISGVAQSQTRLKRLSSSSKQYFIEHLLCARHWKKKSVSFIMYLWAYACAKCITYYLLSTTLWNIFTSPSHFLSLAVPCSI